MNSAARWPASVPSQLLDLEGQSRPHPSSSRLAQRGRPALAARNNLVAAAITSRKLQCVPSPRWHDDVSSVRCSLGSSHRRTEIPPASSELWGASAELGNWAPLILFAPRSAMRNDDFPALAQFIKLSPLSLSKCSNGSIEQVRELSDRDGFDAYRGLRLLSHKSLSPVITLKALKYSLPWIRRLCKVLSMKQTIKCLAICFAAFAFVTELHAGNGKVGNAKPDSCNINNDASPCAAVQPLKNGKPNGSPIPGVCQKVSNEANSGTTNNEGALCGQCSYQGLPNYAPTCWNAATANDNPE
jgi:hypothetical protein